MKALYQIINNNTKKLPFYLTSIGESNEHYVQRENGFNSNHFLIIVSGEGKIECENKMYSLKPGDIIFLRKDIPHCYYPTKGKMYDLWVTFDGNGVDSLLDYYGIENFFIGQNANVEKLIPEFEELKKVALKGISQEKISLLFYNFAIEFFNSVKKEKHETDEAIKFIENNFAKEITLEELAKICGLTKYSFCRHFKENHLSTPFDYILQVRIKNAKQMLSSNPNITNKELSRLCGFNDECYFCRVFKRFEHISPKQFAKMK